METQMKAGRKVEWNARLVVTISTALIIYVLARIYIKSVDTPYDDELCAGATLLFLSGIYIGRFISQLWIHGNKHIPVWILILLPAIITACLFLCALFASGFIGNHSLMHGLFLALPFFILSLSLGMFVKLVRTRIQKQLQNARASAAHHQSELHLLQSQLSPHFLFNTLNNLYGLSITQHEKIPQLLLKLSELLRYSVYETSEELVPLADEMAYINNYIDFEKIRIGERLVLTSNIESVIDNNIRIAPMLLIVFVENAFKHSKNSSEGKIFIDIALKVWNGNILFSINNSYSTTKPGDDLQQNKGLGLSNVKKRLELLYPDQYDLTMEKELSVYKVMLRLKIK